MVLAGVIAAPEADIGCGQPAGITAIPEPFHSAQTHAIVASSELMEVPCGSYRSMGNPVFSERDLKLTLSSTEVNSF